MYKWIIIDGNNLLHSDKEGILFGDRKTDFDSARRKLSRALDELAGAIAERMTVVFDGSVGGRDEAFQTSELRVVFSPAEMDADSVIERIVAEAPDPKGILVVSSDRAERRTVGAAGAEVMSCRNFISLLLDVRRSLKRQLQGRGRQVIPGPSLGDFFPDETLNR